MKKIFTLMLLLGGFVGTASAWTDNTYLRSSIDDWNWEKRTESWKKFTAIDNSYDDFVITLDRATIGGSTLYFSILYEGHLELPSYPTEVRPQNLENSEVTSTAHKTNSTGSTGAFYINLDNDTEKVQIYVHFDGYYDDGYGNTKNHWKVTAVKLKEYSVAWNNSSYYWSNVKAYTKDKKGDHPQIEWLGAWPGTAAVPLGNNLYKATFYGTENVIPVFSEANTQFQTVDLTTVNYGVYVDNESSTPTGVFATISDAGIGTFCSSQKVTVPEGVTASYITGIGDKNVLTTTNFTDGIPANTGALIQGNAGTYTFPITNTSPTAASGNKLVCCLNTTAVSQTSGDNKNYILTKKTVNGTVATPMFFLVNSAGNTVTGGHAYLQLSDPAIAREYFLLWDETESIKNPQLTSDDSQMVYDLQGRRVQQPVKGLYIVDGKKVVK